MLAVEDENASLSMEAEGAYRLFRPTMVALHSVDYAESRRYAVAKAASSPTLPGKITTGKFG
jgi:hypothetical protein